MMSSKMWRYVASVFLVLLLLGCGGGQVGTMTWWPDCDCGCGDDDEEILEDCPGVDIVFVMDTSGSMDSIAQALCGEIDGVVANLLSRGLQDIQAYVYGITESNGDPDFWCLTDNVLNLFGAPVPGNPAPGEENLDTYEDWGPGSAVVCARFPWRLGVIRIVVPLSDEGAENGGTGSDMIDANDSAAMQNLIDVAIANGVIVSPVWGSNDHLYGDQDPAFHAALANIAAATGGSVTPMPDMLGQMADALYDLVVAACAAAQQQPPQSP